jgi:hypothetical protein
MIVNYSKNGREKQKEISVQTDLRAFCHAIACTPDPLVPRGAVHPGSRAIQRTKTAIFKAAMPIFAKSIFAASEKCLSHKAAAEKAVLLLPLRRFFRRNPQSLCS